MLNFLIAVGAVSSGNFLIQYCGAQAGSVKGFLGHAYNSLEIVVETLNSSSDVYKAFFSGVAPDQVKDVFRRITTSPNISVSEASERPVIECVTETQTRVWTFCQKSQSWAAWQVGTQFIFLCPIFWTKLNHYPTPSDCGKVNGAGTRSTGPNLANTQYTVLVHELTHLYLERQSLTPEVYNANDCMALPGSMSEINPNSYALYVGSKSFTSLLPDDNAPEC